MRPPPKNIGMMKYSIQNFLPGVVFLLRPHPAGMVTARARSTVTKVYQMVLR